MRQVPRLSLLHYSEGSPEQRQRFVEQFFCGLKDYGFIILTDHLVSQQRIDEAYRVSKAFFDLPEKTKRQYILENGGGQRGFTAFGTEHAKDYDKADLKEFWHVGREVAAAHPFAQYYPANVWPAEVPEFRSTFEGLYRDMDKTADVMLQALGQALDLPSDYFHNMIDEGNSVLRLIHYPPTKGAAKGAVRAQAHGDINLITLLVGATDSGLQLLDRDGTWLDVQSGPGEIVVDSGDMLSRIANDVIPSTIHRVVNPQDPTSTRYSMPFFVHPHPQAMLECIASCRGEGEKYPPINSHEFLLQRLREIGLMG